jgi:membrane-bound lytic murein transglycosylase D
MKLLFTLILLQVSVPFSVVGQPMEYAKRKANLLARQAQEVFALYEVVPNTTAGPAWKKPSSVSISEIDMLLRKELGDWYAGADSTVLYFVNWWLNQPDQHVRIWLGLGQKLKQQLPSPLENRFFVLAMSQIQLLPSSYESQTYRGVWALHPQIASLYKLIVTHYEDEREMPAKSLFATQSYLKELTKRHQRPEMALVAYFTGSPALNKAILRTSTSASIWQMIPYLPESSRYAYSFFCATAFVLIKGVEWKANPIALNSRSTLETVSFEHNVDLIQVARFTGRDEREIQQINAQYISGQVPAGSLFRVYSSDKKLLLDQKDSLFQLSQPNLPTPIVDTCLVYYRTKSGDYYRDLTRWFGATMAVIQADNGLTGNKLKAGVDLFFRVPCSDSLHFATFDGLSREEKDLLAEGKTGSANLTNQQENKPIEVSKPKEHLPVGKGTKITYVVKSGDTLWAIGQKYKVRDTEIMKWNNVSSKIQPGQKLIIYLP